MELLNCIEMFDVFIAGTDVLCEPFGMLFGKKIRVSMSG
jgi:hypothetical protein